ncbi:hypothetical protein PHYBLDRAFT_69005 [Phycomyces blakesleeanus NRRL 1555(-)]|uniref:Uncharacterized protein n=1 Tax=Phycomyces blakesleeanus (strain ATCC 8743b / DSM 1359 / FGSC 10004 / NBRC 33097 / NRRL 1555) TaxID=763407 RepID=A0A167KMP2_PHYB8|nr:hypothetical protein PHYBLDRAFT_69005 [Phycomyces blakesleeanus NRRL 1555(-)]OAD68445.1 hypothetical protein PHYBLDRAFT_69005 [Phycomyces blakesleeanus NRRL 1555(-)]|eukprot:XP_018286485.1 hypothetical protein PHYBLDRAFT_69005 [Phycomyces blakesleeanus NRRL 1555(-)]
MIQQSLTEKLLIKGLEETLDKIAGSGLLSLEDCQISISDLLYERQCTHKVINENKITDIVIEEYDTDNNAANNNSNEEIAEVESAVPFKRTYSASKKFKYVCTLLDILEYEDIDRDFVTILWGQHFQDGALLFFCQTCQKQIIIGTQFQSYPIRSNYSNCSSWVSKAKKKKTTIAQQDTAAKGLS